MSQKTLVFDKGSIRQGAFSDLKSGKPVWADTTRGNASELEGISRHVGMPVHEIEHLMGSTQRPILFNIDKYSVVVFSGTFGEKETLVVLPVLMFISKDQNDFLTVHREHSRAVSKMYAFTASRSAEMFQGGITLVLLTLLEEIIENFFSDVDGIRDSIEAIEQKMFDYHDSKRVMRKTFSTKKSLLYMHKALIGNREVVQAIEKHYAQFLDLKRLEDFRQLSGDITQLIEMATTYHDILTTSVEVHLSAISNNLNITMKRVTSWGAIILVPSLIAGIFGMNFREIPLLTSHEGFAVSITLMVVSVFLLGWYFKRKDWM
ncbi:MAG: CorA family divalent cation transporter [Parcubacteria group bacterium]